MSLHSDWDAEWAFEIDYPFGIPSEHNPVWTTKNGKKIPVSKMTDEHIEACMRIVGEDDQWYSVFKNELKRRNSNKVNNAEKFKQTFNGLTATEMWSMPEKEFLEWLNKTE